MWVSKLKVKNFRSFGPELTAVDIEKDLTGIVGYNSSGKTALLEACRKAFGVFASERNLLRSDFHVASTDNPFDIDKVEMVIEFDLQFEDEEDGVPVLFDDMVVEAPDVNPYCRIRMEAVWQKDALVPEGSIEQKLYFVRSAEEDIDDGDKYEFPRQKRSLIQTLYVPALRRPSEQLRYASGSLLHRLFQHATWSEDFEKAFQASLDETNGILQGEADFGHIQEKLQESWGRLHKDARYQEATLSVGGPDLDSILRKLEMRFSPGDADRPYTVDELGDGYRSLFYISLVTTLLGLEAEMDASEGKKPYLTIVLVEEPENHIAPQLLGRVLRILKELGELPNVQVILSSHTPAIVSRIEPEGIRHFRLDEATHTTVAHRLLLPEKTDEAFTFVKEAVRNYPEIYFAKLVVIGEGDSEEVVFKRLMRAYDQDFDDHMISCAPLGNRFVNHIWRLLSDLEIPYVTLLDFDRERYGGAWGRIKYAIVQLLETGVEYEQLLALKGGSVMPKQDLEAMHERPNDQIKLHESWVSRLRDFDVFFSYPLDLDFCLLEAFLKEYASIIPDKGGPKIPDKTKDSDAFGKKQTAAIHATLKSEKANGATYSDEQRELMIWYNYHFLGRGKPVTHVQALAGISDKRLMKCLPEPLHAMFKRIGEIVQTH